MSGDSTPGALYPHHTATQVVEFLGCEHAALLTRLDRLQVAGAPVPGVFTGALPAAHGMRHEEACLASYQAEHGEGVVSITTAPGALGVQAAAAETLVQMRAEVPVIYQGVLLVEGLEGRPDFLVRNSAGVYEPVDAKLARSERVGSIVQCVLYAQLLEDSGLPRPQRGWLALGSGVHHEVVLSRYEDAVRVLHQRYRDSLATSPALPLQTWAESRPACTTCRFSAHCTEGREAAQSLSLVADMRSTQRRRLHEAGIDDLEALAGAEESDLARVRGIGSRTLTRLAAQARLQAAQERDPDRKVSYELLPESTLADLPPSSPGDLYFDMEGDPYAEEGEGLEYLFGVVCRDHLAHPLELGAPHDVREDVHGTECFTAIWGHTRSQEREAFETFMRLLLDHRARHPEMHVYHYAPYERTALIRLAALHGCFETEVDELLRDGVLIDLYRHVRTSLLVSQRSYSIKKLEPLYMPVGRTGEVTSGGDSIEEYELYLAEAGLGAAGDAAALEHSRARLTAIAEYNRYDCSSTLHLDQWLRSIAPPPHTAAPHTEESETPQAAAEEVITREDAHEEGRLLAERLRASVRPEVRERTEPASSEEALRLDLADLLGYHRRERAKVFQEYYERLEAASADLAGDRSCLVVEEAQAEEWVLLERRRNPSRVLEITLSEPGQTPFAPGDTPRLRYDLPGGGREVHSGKILEVHPTRLVVEESVRAGSERDDLPVALIPLEYVKTGSIQDALNRVGESVLAETQVGAAGRALLARELPRLRGGSGSSGSILQGGEDLVERAVALTLALDHSYLAVQGPPGAGKTFLGGRLVEALVAAGLRVGVCSSAHKAIDNLLDAALARGVQPVTKFVSTRSKEEPRWIECTTARQVEAHRGGIVTGATVWGFTGAKLRELEWDVIIVDEAGQFPLANALALSAQCRSLVLLGDPQQLPQVSQAAHPGAAGSSSLERVLGEEAVLSPERGVFLAETRRCHPELCEPISNLSYEGQLASHPSTRTQRVEGWSPGVHHVNVVHEEREHSSPEEAEAIGVLVRSLLGRVWTDAAGRERELTQEDIIVVAPYNAQVRAIRQRLEARGYSHVPVGSVDKFQGQEAAVAILSLTASTEEPSGRGLEFLLSRNRLNVALSRGRAMGVLVCSPRLLQTQPRTPRELELLSGLALLLRSAHRVPDATLTELVEP